MVPAGSLQAATKPSLSKTSATVEVGGKLTLKVRNQAKGTSCKWKTSKKSVATVTQKGVVKGVKSGKAVVACYLTKAKKTTRLKCKVTVTGNVEVKTQNQLEKALANANVRNITIRSAARKTYRIPEGNYSSKGLIVKAPNAEVNNYGTFRAVTVKAIKSDTWHEFAKGNTVKVTAAKAHIVAEAGASMRALRLLGEGANVKLDIAGSVASVSMEKKANVTMNVTGSVKAADTALVLDVDGTVSAVRIEKKSSLTITGETKSVSVSVSSDAAGTTVTASVPVEVETSADIKIELQKGAEGSAVKTTDNAVKVEVQNDTTQAVKVATPSGDKTVNAGASSSVAGTPASGNTGSSTSGSSASGSSTPNPGVVAPPSGEQQPTTGPAITDDRTPPELESLILKSITVTTGDAVVVTTSSINCEIDKTNHTVTAIVPVTEGAIAPVTKGAIVPVTEGAIQTGKSITVEIKAGESSTDVPENLAWSLLLLGNDFKEDKTCKTTVKLDDDSLKIIFEDSLILEKGPITAEGEDWTPLATTKYTFIIVFEKG